MQHFKIGQRVKVSEANDNDNYASFRNVVLMVVSGGNSGPGYDTSMYPEYLYDLKNAETGEFIDCALYDYELTAA